ncbi:MAG: helix-turn-helix domain-containing protein [Acholeplasmataceae bacterium]
MVSKDKRHLFPSYPRVYLTQYRLDSNMSGNEVAECIGISLNYYYGLENGSRGHNFGIRLLKGICRCFNVDANTVLEKETRYQKERDVFMTHKKAKR